VIERVPEPPQPESATPTTAARAALLMRRP
jgi:hypothetical protein